MRKALAALSAVTLALVLAGCSAISTGTVTSKDYDPAWQQTVYDYHCMSRNKDGVCTYNAPIPRTVYYPESYTLNLKDGEKTGWVNVSEGEYEDYEVGDHYPKGKGLR